MRRDELPIPTPCHADWNAMELRDKARFCAECSLEVLDVSARTEAEARALATTPSNARVCVSYIVRPDGTIRLAKDTNAPDVPLGALRRRGSALVAAASLALAACGGSRLAGAPVQTTGAIVQPMNVEPPAEPTDPATTDTVCPACDPPTDEIRVRGEMAAPPPPPPPEEVRMQGAVRHRP